MPSFWWICRGRHIFLDWPGKYKLRRGRWDLASCQVSLKSVKGFQRRQKCLRQSEARAVILFFPMGPKITNLVENIEILLPVKQFQRRSQNVLTNQRQERPSCFSDRHEKHTLGRGSWDLTSLRVSLNSVQQFERRYNVSANQRPKWPFCFSNRPEKHKLGRGHLDLASCQVPFSDFGGKLENVSAHQRPGRSYCFSDLPEKTQTC